VASLSAGKFGWQGSTCHYWHSQEPPAYSYGFNEPFDIPPWNQRVDDYIVAIFDFIEKILAFDRVLLLFHLAIWP
jgi:hypothetical protein